MGDGLGEGWAVLRWEDGVAACPWHGAPGSDHLATPHDLRVFCDCIKGPWRGGHQNNPKAGLGPAALCGEQARKELKCGSPSHVQWRVSGEADIQRCVWGLICPSEILLGNLSIPSLSQLFMIAR